MKKMAPILLFIVVPVLCFASGDADEKIDELINFYTYNGEYLKADSLLDAQIAKYPDSPKYYTLKAPFYFYTRYFNRFVLPGDSLMEKCRENAQKAIDLGENSEMTVDNMFYIGTAYGYLARFYGRGQNRSLWNAFWAARSAKSYLNDVLEEDPNYHDARQTLAIFEYFSATQLNGFLGFIAWLVGMDGERDVALQDFQIVSEKGKLFKTEANFVLSVLYRFFENDPGIAIQYTNKLIAGHPQNPWLNNQVAELQLFQLIDTNGIVVLETEYDSLGTKYGITTPGALNTFGYTLSGRGRLEDAIAVFKTNIKLFPDIANGYDSLSEVYLAEENEEMAAHYSQLCLQKLAGDTTITEQFRENLKQINEERLEELGVGAEKINT